MPADLTREEIAAGVRLARWRLLDGMRMLNGCTLIGRAEELGEWVVADPADEGGEPRWVWANHMTPEDGWLPEVDHHGTAGALLHLLGPAACLLSYSADDNGNWQWWDGTDWNDAPNLGTACYRVALARGSWG